jgi:NADPH2:quinone reductase
MSSAPSGACPTVLEVRDVAVPEPGSGQVRVAVRASGMNFAETMQREGRYPGAELPWIPGSEFAGVVEALGPGVTTVQVGARVVARVTAGGYAEYALAAADDLAVVPAGLDFDLATVAAVHAPTALVLVHHVAPVRAGQVVLVHAAAGGIGSLLVQLLADRGATVVAGASSEGKLAVPRARGAAVTVAYSAPDWPTGSGRPRTGAASTSCSPPSPAGCSPSPWTCSPHSATSWSGERRTAPGPSSTRAASPASSTATSG